MADLRVGLYMPIKPGGHIGGVEQFLIGLVSSFGEIDGSEEYVVVTHPDDADWVAPYTGPNTEMVARPWQSALERTKAALGPVGEAIKPVAKPIVDRVSDDGDDHEVRTDTGFLASLDLDVIHFPTQQFVRSDIPSLYNPHDIQHEHYPEFFTEDQLARRRKEYRQGCSDATAIDVPSKFVKRDLIATYDVDPEKIYVVPRGPPVDVYDAISESTIDRTRRKFDVPDAFAFYPAKTWPHKNHCRLIDAIAWARDQADCSVQLVCTGAQTEHMETIRERITHHGLDDQVAFLGYVEQEELRSLYRLSEFVVNPSLFEGGGFPLLEAWYEGVPVTCADATALQEKAGEAALLFDPESVSSIGEALVRMHTDAKLRDSLRKRGSKAVASHDWHETARIYQALYRSVAGASLSKDQRSRLQNANRTDAGDE